MSESSPPSREDLLAVENEALRDLVSSMWLYTSRHTWTQLTTEQKELFADVVDADHVRQDALEGTSPDLAYTPLERWWRDEPRAAPSVLTAFRADLPASFLPLLRQTSAHLAALGFEGSEEYRDMVSRLVVHFLLNHPLVPAAASEAQVR